jgi:hypothetical protein
VIWINDQCNIQIKLIHFLDLDLKNKASCLIGTWYKIICFIPKIVYSNVGFYIATLNSALLVVYTALRFSLFLTNQKSESWSGLRYLLLEQIQRKIFDEIRVFLKLPIHERRGLDFCANIKLICFCKLFGKTRKSLVRWNRVPPNVGWELTE